MPNERTHDEARENDNATNWAAARGDENGYNLTLSPSESLLLGDLTTAREALRIDWSRPVDDQLNVERVIVDVNQYDSGAHGSAEQYETRVRLGLTQLEIPPDSIRVQTISKSQELPGLRTTTNALVKSGHEQIRIDMSVIFPDLESMNRDLRELVAQFRLTPVLPLESVYVANAVIQQQLPDRAANNDELDLGNQREIERAQGNLTDETIRLTDELKSSVRSFREIYQNHVPQEFFTLIDVLDRIEYDPDRNNLDAIANLIEQTNGIGSVMADSIREGDVDNTFLREFRRILDYYARIQSNYARLETIKVRHDRRENGFHQFMKIVPVILNTLNVTTIPEFPESFMANISLMYFNYAPYSQYFEFKGADGNPVEFIQQCPWMRRYINSALSLPIDDASEVNAFRKDKRHLKLIDESNRGYLGFRYPTTQLHVLDQGNRLGTSKVDVTQSVQVRSDLHSEYFANSFSTPVIRDNGLAYVNEYKDFFIRNTDIDIIVESITVGMQNRIAVQPILSSVYPTAQYVGGMNALITVKLKVMGDTQAEHDEAVAAIEAIKREAENVSVMYGPRARRDNKIFIANDLINLMGVGAVQWQDLAIETDHDLPRCSNVTINMIEFTSSQTEREVLEFNRGKISDNVRVALGFGLPRIQAYLLTRSGNYGAREFTGTTVTRNGSRINNILRSSADGGLEGALPRTFFRDALASAASLQRLQRVGAAYVLPDEAAQLISDSDFTEGLRVIRQILGQEGLSNEVRVERLTKFRDSRDRLAAQYPDNDPRKAVSLALGELANSGLREIINREVVNANLQGGINPLGSPAETSAREAIRPSVQNILQNAQDASDFYMFQAGIVDNQLQDTGYGSGLRQGFEPPTIVPVRVLQAALLKDPIYVRALQELGPEDQFDSRVREYARHLLTRWSGLDNETETELFRGSEQLLIQNSIPNNLRNLIIQVVRDIETTGGVEIIPGLLTRVRLPDTIDLQKIYNGIEWLRTNFEAFDKLIATEGDRFNTNTAHPDLFLPSYGEVYAPVWAAIRTHFGIEFGENTDLDSLAPELRDFVSRFIPLYADLGISPPPGKQRWNFARNIGDQVEPGFFWYHTRVLNEDASAKVTQALRSAAGENEQVLADPANNRVVVDSTGVQRGAPPNTDPRIYNLGNGIANVITSSAEIDLAAGQRLEAMINANLDRRADDLYSMRRFYPSFKLYFVEPGVNSIGYADDLYGYNSVLGIKVHRHVFYPDTLELDLLNVSGTLDDMSGSFDELVNDDEARLFGQNQRRGIRNNTTVPSLVTDLQQRANDQLNPPVINIIGRPAPLQQLFVREGTMLVMKMGYSNRPSELETVFTGQIAEINKGDVLNLVAQSYAVELTVPLHEKNVTGALRIGAAVMSEPAVTHFGVENVRQPNADALARARLNRIDIQDGHWDNTGPNDPMVRTRRLDNFFLGGLDDSSGAWFARHWFGQTQGLKFDIPNRTGLEVLHELARHHPGIVCGVRPYDNDATLFVGFPSQMYRYTDDGLEEELLSQPERVNEQFQADTPDAETIKTKVLVLMAMFAGTGGNLGRDPRFQAFTEDEVAEFRSTANTLWGRGLDRELTGNENRSFIRDWNSLQDKIGSEGMRMMTRILYNDLHYLVDGGAQQYNPIMFRSSDGSAGNANNLFAAIGEAGRNLGQTGAAIGNFVADVATEIATGAVILANGFTLTAEQREDAHRSLMLYEAGTANYGNAFSAIPIWEAMSRDIMNLTGRLWEDDIGRDILMWDSSFRGVNNWRDKAENGIARGARCFRNFVRIFNEWLEEQIEDNIFVRAPAEAARTLSEQIANTQSRGQRPFRNFHWVDSYHHILKNNIRATTDMMSNVVQVKYPESRQIDGDENEGYIISSSTKWKIKEVPYHKDQRPQDKKVRTVTEINADHENRAVYAGTSSLAQGISEMYRGDLVLQGNATIQPYDVILMFDFYNLVFGPVEVEAVTHVFLPDTGFASIVQPRALVAAGHTLDRKQVLSEATIATRFMQDVHVKVVDKLVRSLPDYMDDSRDDEDRYRPNVMIFPLTHNGRPWLAGLRGPDDKWQSFDINGRFEFQEAAQAAIIRQRQLNGTLPSRGQN